MFVRIRSLVVLLIIGVLVLAACAPAGSQTSAPPTQAPSKAAATSEAPAKPAEATMAAPTAQPTAKPLSLSKIRYAAAGATYETILYVAEEKGFLKEEGLTTERVQLAGGVDLTAALAGGSVDLATLSTQLVVNAVAKGVDLRSILCYAHGPNEFGVLRTAVADKAGVTDASSIDAKIKALKGLKVGTGRPGSTTTVLAVAAMQQRGLDTNKDVTLVPLGNGQAMLPAFEQGQIDAFFWIPPEPQIVIQKKAGIPIDFRQLPELKAVDWATYGTTQTLIDEHPDTVLAFARAMARAWQYAMADKAGTYEITKKRFPKMDPTALQASFDVDYDSYKQGFRFTEDGYQKATMIANLSNEKKVDVPMEKVVTNQFVEQALKDLGLTMP